MKVLFKSVKELVSLAGVVSRIPTDGVIEAMHKISQSMPAALRETAKGGLAVTPWGKALEAKVFGEKTVNHDDVTS